MTEAFHELIILRWGAPRVVICDNGTQFTSKGFYSLMEEFHVKIRFTPPYTPQANPVERVNRVLKTMISCYVTKVHDMWDAYMPEFIHAMNTAVHESTVYASAYLNFGREPQLPNIENVVQDEVEVIPSVPKTWIKRLKNLKNVISLVRDNLDTAHRKARHYYNLRQRDVQFYVGQQVLRRNYTLSKEVLKYSAGLAPEFIGPLRVKKKCSPVRYELETLDGVSCGIWHVKDLKIYHHRS